MSVLNIYDGTIPLSNEPIKTTLQTKVVTFGNVITDITVGIRIYKTGRQIMISIPPFESNGSGKGQGEISAIGVIPIGYRPLKNLVSTGCLVRDGDDQCYGQFQITTNGSILLLKWSGTTEHPFSTTWFAGSTNLYYGLLGHFNIIYNI